MNKKKSIWKKSVDKHDYDAAYDYLTLLYSKDYSKHLVEEMRNTPICTKHAKDLFRASGHDLLSKNNVYVKKDLDKIKKGIKLSPVLLVSSCDRLIIADGFHRISAGYLLGENEEIPCVLVN